MTVSAFASVAVRGARVLSALCLLAAAGCAKHSSFAPLTITHATEAGAGGEGCGWVKVKEKGLLYDDQLYYCCPGSDGKSPVCLEAAWKSKE